MSNDMVSNAKDEVDQASKVANEISAGERKVTLEAPPGCVARRLTTRDRNMFSGAAMRYLQEKKRQTDRNHSRLIRLKKVLRFEETLDYFAQVQEDLEERTIKWDGQKNLYVIWQQINSGAVSLSDVQKQYPSLSYDANKPPEKPSPRRPDFTDQENVGVEDVFFIPIKLEAWICDVLKAMDSWDPKMNEGTVEILRKYGILKEDDDL